MYARRVSLFAILSLVVILLLTLLPGINAREEGVQSVVAEEISKKGKWSCVVCTMIAGILSQLMEKHKINAEEAMSMFCGFLPGGGTLLCKLGSFFLWKKAFPLLDKNETPDAVCQGLNYCLNPQCHLFPLRTNEQTAEYYVEQLRVDTEMYKMEPISVCTFFPNICRAAFDHLPAKDNDGDFFSTEPVLRGTNWRGRDCDDNSPTTYPGRDTLDATKDENCNGIYGVDKETKKTYEELWCGNESKPMGVIAIGDSATAHFAIPENLLNVSELSKAALKNITHLAKNEFDWPMISYSTGFLSADDFAPSRVGETKSVYLEFLKRNRCNHRDYQNVAVNGASTQLLSSLVDIAVRDRAKKVKPALVLFSMIGNDVCNVEPTTPTDYYNNIMSALDKANDKLPEGSHVIILPVSDGRVLYNAMHNRIHPIGSLRADVTYANFYDFLNCLDVSPCPGWLNTNAAVRENTFKNVQALNAQIPLIVENSRKKHKVIKTHFIGDVINEVLEAYKGNLWDLIEAVDGFHPSHRAHALIGEHISQKIMAEVFSPPINPFNAAIEKRFGDQGGY